MGILFAFVALFSWGVADFLIQRSARKFGDWEALFFVTFFAFLVLTPFILQDIRQLLANASGLIILILTGFVMLLASLFDFEALKKGKISIVEPIFAFEIPIAAILASVVIKEHLSLLQIILIIILALSIMLISSKSFVSFKKIHLEKGVLLALLATCGMGIGSFMYGVGSRATNPLILNWLVSLFMAVTTFVYLVIHKRVAHISRDWNRHAKLILAVGFADILAWVAFAYSALYIPIAIATGISEGYIAAGAILGILFNKERLRKHQIVALISIAVTVIALASITTG